MERLRLGENWQAAWWAGLICLVLGTPAGADEPLTRFEFLQIRMGVPVRILVYAPNEASANQGADAAYQRIRDLDRALSDYDPDSELIQLCENAQPGVPQPVSCDLLRVLTTAQRLSEESDGAFDVTVSPLVKLWRIARRRKALPDPEALAQAQSRVGFRNMNVDPQAGTVTFLQPDMLLDLGGIAKGFAADEAFHVLEEQGLSRALVAVAGDIRAGDPPPGEQGWKIAVERRGAERQDESLETQELLLLDRQAISTSGDTYQFLEVDGVRYSHIINPKTGMGLTDPGAVTIVAPTGLLADGLASVVSVLGPEKGIEAIEAHPHVEAFVVRLNDSAPSMTWQSSGWKSLPRATGAGEPSVEAP